jgi:hypothetical protein
MRFLAIENSDSQRRQEFRAMRQLAPARKMLLPVGGSEPKKSGGG